MGHLRELGGPDDENLDNFNVARKWKFTRTHDNGEPTEECPCGKKGIRYLMYIKHEETGNETFVGSECVKIFEERLQNVMKVALTLMQTGLKGTFKGVTEGASPKLRFQINANHGLVKNIADFKVYFNHVPVCQSSQKWECRVFPPKRARSVNYSTGLTKEQKYNLKLKLSRWTQGYGTGFSLDIIECTVIAN